LLAGTAEPLPLVLELKDQAAKGPTLDQVQATFDKVEKIHEAKRSRAVRP
jgi:hypothetical protein